MLEALGPEAVRLRAVELTPENAPQVEAHTPSGEFQCPVDVCAGDVTALP